MKGPPDFALAMLFCREAEKQLPDQEGPVGGSRFFRSTALHSMERVSIGNEFI